MQKLCHFSIEKHSLHTQPTSGQEDISYRSASEEVFFIDKSFMNACICGNVL